jgi:hypothetical protein
MKFYCRGRPYFAKVSKTQIKLAKGGMELYSTFFQPHSAIQLTDARPLAGVAELGPLFPGGRSKAVASSRVFFCFQGNCGENDGMHDLD